MDVRHSIKYYPDASGLVDTCWVERQHLGISINLFSQCLVEQNTLLHEPTMSLTNMVVEL